MSKQSKKGSLSAMVLVQMKASVWIQLTSQKIVNCNSYLRQAKYLWKRLNSQTLKYNSFTKPLMLRCAWLATTTTLDFFKFPSTYDKMSFSQWNIFSRSLFVQRKDFQVTKNKKWHWWGLAKKLELTLLRLAVLSQANSEIYRCLAGLEKVSSQGFLDYCN